MKYAIYCNSCFLSSFTVVLKVLLCCGFEARAAWRGLWADADPVAPWDWRKEKRGHRLHKVHDRHVYRSVILQLFQLWAQQSDIFRLNPYGQTCTSSTLYHLLIYQTDALFQRSEDEQQDIGVSRTEAHSDYFT